MEVAENGRVLGLAGGRQRALLGLLLLHADEVVAQDQLIDALWGESPPPTARTALHGHVSRLRDLIGPERLETRPPGYVLRLAPDELDLRRFERLIAQKRYADALSLWRGPPLSDLAFESFARGEIVRLEELRARAVESRFERELAEGRHAELVGELEAAAAEEPLRERLAAQLMLALYRSGRQADALAAYRATRATLVDELGLEPGEELRELERRILEQDPGLEVVRPARSHTNLPAAATSFVGRLAELEQVRALLARPDTRLLTLTGAGGVGKTRLALEAARAVAGDFEDGAWFVPLAAVRNTELMGAAIVRELRLQPSRGQPIGDALSAFLRERELLLVLDNLEHLLEATPLAGALLAAAPGLKILATSRTHLNLYGESEYAVPPLARAAAMSLFANRAGAARTGFALTDDNGQAVAEICARLDGLPLAIELAAAQIRTLEPSQILARLEHRLELLTGGPRDVPARQRTLRDTILWSHDLLMPVQQRLFARLAAFSGGWSAEAAGAVCCQALGVAAPDGLASLAATSLVREDATRFSMLETVRELACELLAASGEEQLIRAAHARWVLAAVEEGGPNRHGLARADWLARLERERENVRAALAWCAGERGDAETGLRLAASVVPYWLAHGLIAEGLRALEAALAGPHAPSHGRSRALAMFAFLALIDGDVEGSERASEESLRRSWPGEEWYRAVSLNVSGTAHRYRRRYDEARRRYEDGLTLAAQGDLWWPAALAHANLGFLAGIEGRTADAVASHERCSAIARQGGDAWMAATSLTNAGRALRQLGELDRAVALQSEALRGFGALDNAWGVAVCLAGFAGLAADRGDPARAARLYGAEEALRERTGIALWPTIRSEHEDGVAATAAALGERAWSRARAQGGAMTEEAAIAEARAVAALQPRAAGG